MPRTRSILTTRRGEFRSIYRALKRQPALFAATPIVFCEGDSWFSTPLDMNLLDWLVFAAPEDEARGVPIFGQGGLFFRVEESGHQATPNPKDPGKSMFSTKNIKDLTRWFAAFDFDIVVLSAGGNDFIGDYLTRTFRGQSAMTPQQAFDRVRRSGRFEEVRRAYEAFLKALIAAKPGVPVLSHTYDYPRLLGTQAALTLSNLGAAALLAKGIGPWIEPHIRHVLTTRDTQRSFAALLIDGFEAHVLRPLKTEFAGTFDYVDLRGTLPRDKDWFDEMHPTSAGFHALATIFRAAIRKQLPPAKRLPT